MKPFYSITLSTIASVVLSSNFSSAHAVTIGSAILEEFTGDDAEVLVRLEDVSGGVKFSVNIERTPTINGDLLGFFAHVKNNNVGAITDITGTDVTSYLIDTNNVINLGGGNNLNGFSGGKFDFGVTFGRSGSSGGLLSSTMFTVLGLSVSDFDGQVLGGRLQSTGLSLNGSSKLSGVTGLVGGPPTAVPEPSTIFGTAMAVGFGSLFQRKRSKLKAKEAS